MFAHIQNDVFTRLFMAPLLEVTQIAISPSVSVDDLVIIEYLCCWKKKKGFQSVFNVKKSKKQTV